uniref:60S ribosomal export protein NMD3 n=1 Tax=Saccoglossus kowalevskii TaxID=10224 RepID=A0ABM0GRK5_SACKO|nr:PREDICTED: 60S ribosomal export protein NMD3-like [Saccoglossus kowalevskii]
MEYMVGESGTTQGRILCCQCGIAIESNPANMCVSCIRTQVDITEGIPKQGVIYFCKNCERYLQPPESWVVCTLESRELLSLCLKKLKGLNKVNLVDAGFIWTEPHSKRLKVKLTIQKEVLGGTVLQQVFVVEFMVHYQMCSDCHRVEAKDFWKACVQVRQKTTHKKTFFYLEQLILKHRAHTSTVNIKAHHDGLDFYYEGKQDARKLVEFLQTVVPCRYQTSQRLISHDTHNNTYNYKTTYSVEIVPICKDNIVCLPPKLAQSLGNIGQICLCQRVSNLIHIIDPTSLQIADVTAPVYWRTPFNSLCELKNLTEYIVLQIEPIAMKDMRHQKGQGAKSYKHILADVWVARSQDLGINDAQFHTRTHLGHLLNPGDTVLGFDFLNANVNDQNFDKVKAERLPDVILVKKSYDKQKRKLRRNWKLRQMSKHSDALDDDKMERDYSEFLEDLEDDPEYRQHVNIYMDRNKSIPVESSDDDDAPKISLQEMLEDLNISEDATGGEGAAMLE